MDRERWTSFPAATNAERAWLAALDGFSAHRSVPLVGADGRRRSFGATLSIEVAEPFDGTADVVVRLAFDEPGPDPQGTPAESAWELLDAFLGEAEAKARRRAADAR